MDIAVKNLSIDYARSATGKCVPGIGVVDCKAQVRVMVTVMFRGESSHGSAAGQSFHFLLHCCRVKTELFHL